MGNFRRRDPFRKPIAARSSLRSSPIRLEENAFRTPVNSKYLASIHTSTHRLSVPSELSVPVAPSGDGRTDSSSSPCRKESTRELPALPSLEPTTLISTMRKKYPLLPRMPAVAHSSASRSDHLREASQQESRDEYVATPPAIKRLSVDGDDAIYSPPSMSLLPRCRSFAPHPRPVSRKRKAQLAPIFRPLRTDDEMSTDSCSSSSSESYVSVLPPDEDPNTPQQRLVVLEAIEPFSAIPGPPTVRRQLFVTTDPRSTARATSISHYMGEWPRHLYLPMDQN